MNTSSIHIRSTGWSTFLGLVLILAGLLAITAPFLAGIVVSIFFGWLILVAGVAHLVYAWKERGAGSVIWQILIDLVYLLAPFYPLVYPVHGIVAITLLLALYFALEGIFELIVCSRWRRLPGFAWFLVDGIISLLLGALIFLRRPPALFGL